MGISLGVMLGVYTAGVSISIPSPDHPMGRITNREQVSGAHLNPAVTFANWLVPIHSLETCKQTERSSVYRKFPWKKWPGYAVAQVLGAMCAAAVVYGTSLPPLPFPLFFSFLIPLTGNYKSAIDVYEGGPGIRTVPGFSNHSTAGIFCTYPASFMTRTGQFFSEFIASTILMFLIYALQDNGNLGAANLTPLMLFFVIFGIGACFGWETGYAINLARDFGKSLMNPQG
jgi:aquaglyceroporin related protein